MPDNSWGRHKAVVRMGTDGYGWVRRWCAAIFYPWVLTARIFTRTAYLGGADVRQVGQVRQVGHQTAAPKRLSYRSGHTALVHNRSGMLAQAAQELSYLAGIAVRRDILPTGTDCALFYLHGLSWRRIFFHFSTAVLPVALLSTAGREPFAVLPRRQAAVSFEYSGKINERFEIAGINDLFYTHVIVF